MRKTDKARGIHSSSAQDDVDQRRLADFQLLPKERFPYEYDVHSNGQPRWRHQVRFERTLPVEPRRLYPVCIGGVGTAPPENCGGPQGLVEFRGLFTPGYTLHRLAALLEKGLTAKGIEELRHLLTDGSRSRNRLPACNEECSRRRNWE